MLASDMNFGFFQRYEKFFTETSEYTDTTILKNAVRCPTYDTCLNWTVHYHNISTILNVFTKAFRHAAGIWTDENSRTIACDLEYCGAETSGVAFWVSQGSSI
jgi:hypothetical protein